jgi:hypothetical protein
MATTQQVVTSQLPTAFEEFYKTGAQGVPGLIPQAFKLYGAGSPAEYQTNIKGPLEAANLYTGAQRVAGLTPGQQQVGAQLLLCRPPGSLLWGLVLLAQAMPQPPGFQVCWIRV